MRLAASAAESRPSSRVGEATRLQVRSGGHLHRPSVGCEGSAGTDVGRPRRRRVPRYWASSGTSLARPRAQRDLTVPGRSRGSRRPPRPSSPPCRPARAPLRWSSGAASSAVITSSRRSRDLGRVVLGRLAGQLGRAGPRPRAAARRPGPGAGASGPGRRSPRSGAARWSPPRRRGSESARRKAEISASCSASAASSGRRGCGVATPTAGPGAGVPAPRTRPGRRRRAEPAARGRRRRRSPGQAGSS